MTLLEDPPQRLRWQAHLEFTHNHDVGDLTWDKIAVSLPRSEKLRSLVLAGIPHSMRPQVKLRGRGHSAKGAGSGVPPKAHGSSVHILQLWMRLSGALQKKRNSELSYREVVKNSSNDETIAAKQVRLGQHRGPFRKHLLVRNRVWACRRAVSCLGLQEAAPVGLSLAGVARESRRPCGSPYTPRHVSGTGLRFLGPL